MILKKKTETVHVVDYGDLDAFVQHHTGRKDYGCVALQEWSNDSQHRCMVDAKFAKRDYEKFKAGRHDGQYRLNAILDCLCAEGKLEAGTYVIEVCW